MNKSRRTSKGTGHKAQRGDVPYGVQTAVGTVTGALVGGAFAGPLGAAFGGVVGLLIGFASDEDDRRNREW